MAAISREDIVEIAQLARLHLEDGELERIQHELGTILEHFAALSAVDTTDVAPMTHAVAVDARLRADETAPSLGADVALRGAPARDGDLFVVPAILPGAE
jgi:aspartyl-tRNA(Asn)/glutamyl-tRNA(Gln) amidotransferase subunit C